MGDRLRDQFPVRDIYLGMWPGQLSLALPPCIGAVSTSQRATTPCGWGVKVWFVSGWQVKLCDPLVTHGPYLSALEMYHDKALYMFTLRYFTLQTDRRMNRWTDRQTDEQMNRQTDGQPVTYAALVYIAHPKKTCKTVFFGLHWFISTYIKMWKKLTSL